MVLSAVVLLGLVVAARSSRLRWATVTYLFLAAAYFCVAAVQTPADPGRDGVLVQRTTAGRGHGAAGRRAGPDRRPALAARRCAAGRDASRPAALGPAALALVVVVYLVATLGNNLPAQVARLGPVYRPADPRAVLLPVSSDRALEQLARSVPPDAVVADNPWRGHALLYAFGSRRVVFFSEKAVTTPDRKLVADQLYLAGTPYGGLVCGAVRRLDVTYVITGGANALPNLGRPGRVPGDRPGARRRRVQPGGPVRSVPVVADHGLFVTRGPARRSGGAQAPDGY